VPITGTPSSLGDLVCRVRFSLDGEVKFEGEVQGSVNSSNELFRMGFDLFVWGGNYPDNRKGPGPNGSATAGKDFVGTEPSEPDVITAGSDGTNDVFKTMSEEYRINRGVEKWDGQRVYEHPGYVKLGVTNNGGWIMTPELEQLSAVPETVVVVASISCVSTTRREPTSFRPKGRARCSTARSMPRCCRRSPRRRTGSGRR